MSTPRKRPKRAFGLDKALLDAVPLHKFVFKAHKHCWSHEHEDISLHYGQILDDHNVSREVWAHLTKSGRAGEVHYIGIHPAGGSPVQIKAKDIAERAVIRDEFQPVSGRVQENTALLRACIMLHSEKVASENLNFSETFLKSLRRACGRYRDNTQGQIDAMHTPGGHNPTTGYCSSPEVPLALESSTRKDPRATHSMIMSEQQGPQPPHFDTLHPQSSPLPTFRAGHMSEALSKPISTACSTGYTNIGQTPDYKRRTAHDDTCHPTPGRIELDKTNSNETQAPVEPRAMMHMWSKLNHEQTRQFSNCDTGVKIDKAGYAASSVDLQPQTPFPLTKPMMKADTPKAASPRELSMKSSKLHISDSVAPSAFDKFFAIRNEAEVVRGELERCEQSILEANAVWAQRRENKCREIDEDLRQKHNGELAMLKVDYEQRKLELHARHKTEHAELKAQYNKMKEEQQLDVGSLREIKDKKAFELEALEHKLAEKGQMLKKDPEKLLDALLAQGITNSKRKREDSPDIGVDLRDRDITMTG